MREAIHPECNAAVGVQLHFIDIYLEELAKVGAKEVGSEMIFQIPIWFDKWCLHGNKGSSRNKSGLSPDVCICNPCNTLVSTFCGD